MKVQSLLLYFKDFLCIRVTSNVIIDLMLKKGDKMKIILSTLNSKFIHSSLSIRYLKEYVNDIVDAEIREYTINQNIDYIVSDLYKSHVDIIGFSTYIWNSIETLEVCKTLKIVKPSIKILLGGPEVSYDGKQVLQENPYIDFVIYGEGEETFKEFVQTLLDQERDYKDIEGLIYRKEDKIVENNPRNLICDLDKIVSPYREIEDDFENKIVYFESSRGCPFNCKFCLSSTIKGVRYFQIDKVKEELNNLIEAKVRQVKFVDRTFNANKKYSMDIMNFIMEKNPKNMNFHFEVTAHLIDDKMLEFLSTVKEGLFQFEVGVQTTNPKTIKAIGRTTDFKKLKKVTKKIKSYGNIHQHLDLIAGLPYENYNSFKKSFNDVYDIKPDKIQLGFLKLLKGSELRRDEAKYGYKYLDIPPYEVLENDFISYGEIIKLKGIEDLVEKYYNEGYFQHSVEFIIKNYYNNPFDFYEDFLKYWEEKAYNKVSHSRRRLYEILIEFYKYQNYKNFIIFSDLIKYDFIMNNKGKRVPKGSIEIEDNIDIKTTHDILKDNRVLNNYLEEYKALPTKIVIRDIDIKSFKVNVFKIINNNYLFNDEMEEEVEILFVYRKGVINRCKAYDITHITKEMI